MVHKYTLEKLSLVEPFNLLNRIDLQNILDKSSFVIGSRYIEGGKCEMSSHRLMLSIIGNRFIKKILRINCNEFTTSYRGFNLLKLNKKTKVGLSFSPPTTVKSIVKKSIIKTNSPNKVFSRWSVMSEDFA